jgi:hypothetical protein
VFVGLIHRFQKLYERKEKNDLTTIHHTIGRQGLKFIEAQRFGFELEEKEEIY